MKVAVKVRLKPTIEQEKKMWQSVGTSRWVYNWALHRQEKNYQNGGKFITDGDLRKELTLLKKTEEYKWLSYVSNNVAKQAVKDLCGAYQNFFQKKADRPRFKSRKRSKPSFYHDTDKLKVGLLTVALEKIGQVKTVEQLPMGCKYMNPRITHDGKYWYLSVCVKKELEKPILIGESVGVDLGIKSLAVMSNGMMTKNINKSKSVKKVKRKLRRLQRQVSRKYQMNKEGSRFVKTCNIIKLEKQIRTLHRRLNGIRKNHIHQSINDLVKTNPSRIVVEDLNVSGMMKNKHLSKAVQEQKFYDYQRILEYKCEWLGIEFVKADRFYPSSKRCSCCGNIKKDLKLSDRIYKCSNCGLEIDRDFNASVNLSKYELVA